MLRGWARALCAAGALVSLGVAAYLAFDWADYGTDSTCGNFLHYEGAGPTCSHIMRNRVIGVVVLVAIAAALVVTASLPRRTGAASVGHPEPTA